MESRDRDKKENNETLKSITYSIVTQSLITMETRLLPSNPVSWYFLFIIG
jgi:hypothetical protein